MAFLFNGRAYQWSGLGSRGMAASAIADPHAVLDDLLLSYGDIVTEPSNLHKIQYGCPR
jgi:hypothetical protein